MTRKFIAVVVSFFWTVLPCFLAGCLVGAFFVKFFWYWAIGIAVITLPWLLLNRVQVRLFHGHLQGRTVPSLLKYGYTSTDFYPKHMLFGGGWWNWYWGFFRRHF